MGGFGALLGLLGCVGSAILVIKHDWNAALGLIGISVVLFSAERFVK